MVSPPEVQELYGYVPASEGLPMQTFLERFHEHDRGKALARVEMVCTSPVGL